MADDSEVMNDTEWADTVDYRLLLLERNGKTLRLGVIIGVGSGVAGIAMSLILGKTVAKMADQMGQLGEITKGMLIQLNPSMGGLMPQPGSATGAPGPDVPPPSTDGAARVFLDPRSVDETRKPPEGSVVGEASEGPTSEVPDWARQALENEQVDAKGAAPDAGTAVILDDDDIKPVS